MLPEALQAAIDEIVARGDRREVERTALALSESYRAGGSAATRAARTRGEVVAYTVALAVSGRVPALTLSKHELQ